MKLTVIGCSDAFSAGGRYHSCYILDTSQGRLMIDCGANSPLALKRAGIDVATIDAIVISHCHGDHFGGLPFLFLDKMFLKRTASPLELLGPQGFQARTEALLDCLYPSIRTMPRPFEVTYRELVPGAELLWRGISISAFPVEHYSGTPSLAVRLSDKAETFAFSGDSGWCDGVIDAGRGSDLYLIECSTYSTKLDMHLDYLTLETKFRDIGAKRYVLTHLSDEMLKAAGKIDHKRCILAEDGLSINIGSAEKTGNWLSRTWRGK
jgi:ribonuclease BN (tRNA processing enzyme)